jgi:hypothetical protein
MRILILGYRGSGKTTAGDIIAFADPECEPHNTTPPKSVSTSDILIRKYAQSTGLSVQRLVFEKDLHREALWKFGRILQGQDPSTIVREALVEASLSGCPKPWKLEQAATKLNSYGYVAVTGVRNQDELKVCRDKDLFNAVLWITRPGVGPGPTDYLGPIDADAVILNNGTPSELKNSLIRQAQRYTTTKCDSDWICSGLEVFDR